MSTALAPLAAVAQSYLDQSLSEGTRTAYASDWRIFAVWCQQQKLAIHPAAPETVVQFLADEARNGIAPSTLTRRVAAIKFAHEQAGLPSPTKSHLVAATLKGIRRAHGSAPKQKAPATVDRIEHMVGYCDTSTLTGQRDKALLLLGFAGAFRRSELSALRIDDLAEVPEGLRVLIRHSKTDQEGKGRTVPIYSGARLSVPKAIKEWMDAAGISKGPLFRQVSQTGVVGAQALSPLSVAHIVKRYARLAGFDEREFSGHSLRSGFLTSAAESGASLFKMMDVSGHKEIKTLARYVRMAEQFKDHAGAKFL